MSRGKGNKKSHKQGKQEQSKPPIQSSECPTDLLSPGSSSTNETVFHLEIDPRINSIFQINLDSEEIEHEKYIEKCNSLSETLKELQVEINKRVTKSLKKDAYAKWKDGQLEEAKILLEKVLNIGKDKEIEKKLKELETLIQTKVNVKEAEQLNELGNISYKKDEFNEALNYYDQAIKLNGDNMVYFNNKAAVYFKTMDYDNCLEQCNKAIDVGVRTKAENKFITKAINRMALTYIRMHKHNYGVLIYENSLKVCQSQEIVIKLAKLRRLMRLPIDSEERNELIKEVYEFPDSSGKLLSAIARENISKKYLQELEEDGKVIAGAMRMNDPNDFLELAISNMKIGNHERSVKLLTRVMQDNPNKAFLYRLRGSSYFECGKFKEAFNDLDENIRRRPNCFRPHVVKGNLLRRAKRYNEAARNYKIASKLDSKIKSILSGIIPKLEQGKAPSAAEETIFVYLGYYLNTADAEWE